jgi:hypothetical protein
MTSRHAAALALVGWYLMTPPLNHRSVRTPDGTPASQVLQAVLPRLSLKRPFDSGNECRTRKSSNTRRIANARFLMIAIARLTRTEGHISKANCVTRSVSRLTIRASNQNNTLTISNSDTQGQIKTTPASRPLLCEHKFPERGGGLVGIRIHRFAFDVVRTTSLEGDLCGADCIAVSVC